MRILPSRRAVQINAAIELNLGLQLVMHQNKFLQFSLAVVLAARSFAFKQEYRLSSVEYASQKIYSRRKDHAHRAGADSGITLRANI
mmetsp:Transcript_12739/g.31275  ORF Transcript_12739/g.31275 Transcript_12739/m.31275 type:complete len:87 (+) Transcript_12739:922-1182(+)